MEQIQKTYVNRKPIHIVPEILKLQDEDPVTVQDPQELQALIGGFKQKIQDLIAEIYDLTVEKQKDKAENEVIMQKMRDDQSRYIAQIEKYRTSIKTIQQTFQSDKQKFEQDKQRDRRNMQNSKAAEMIELQRKIDELNAIYLQQQKYELLEKSYIDQISKLKQTYVQAEYKHHDAMNFEQKKQTKQNENVKSRNQLTKKDTLKNAYIEAEKNVIEEQKQALARNKQLKDNLLGYQKELDKLKKEIQHINKVNREVKINASINLEGLEEYKAVGALQIAKIKSYRDKVETMKNIIAEEVATKTKVIRATKQKNEARLHQLRRHHQQVKAQLNIKSRQLATMKQLAQTILQQRSQVEEFFLTAMEHVSNQIKTEPSTNQPKTYKQKVDISQLDVADKQKILRTLFTRISMGTKRQLA